MAKGNVLSWINNNGASHTATARDLSFDTGIIPIGHSASVVMTSEPGTVIPYYCVLHPWMSGTINVISEEAAEIAEERITPNDTRRDVPFITTEQIISAPEILSVENGVAKVRNVTAENTTDSSTFNATSASTAMNDTNNIRAEDVGNGAAPDGVDNTGTNTDNLDDAGISTTNNIVKPAAKISYISAQSPFPFSVSPTDPSATNIATTATATTATTATTNTNSTIDGEGRVDYGGNADFNITRPIPQVSTEFPDSMKPTVIKELPPKTNQGTGTSNGITTATNTETGFEEENKDNWITTNHDVFYTRSSNQTTITKDNVMDLQIKWVLDNPQPIENPPIIVDGMGFAHDNGGTIIAFNATTGANLWKVDTGRGGLLHGLTYDDGVIFVGTGGNATVIALNATNGDKFWETAPLGPKKFGYGVGMPR